MSSYKIAWGDTLSHLAKRFNTSVSALAKTNNIKNPDLIYAGASLKIPDGFDGAKGGNKVDLTGRAGVGGSPNASAGRAGGNPSGHEFGVGHVDGTGASRGAQGSILEMAQRYLNRNAGDIKLGSDALGRAMQDWVPNNVNCANFVSGVLIASGKLPSNQGSAGVIDLMGKLDRNGYQRVSSSNMQPGDVVSMKTNGGQHVVIYAGEKNGKPMYIGSNNVNPDRSQRVTYTQMQYPIMAVHRYNR